MKEPTVIYEVVSGMDYEGEWNAMLYRNKEDAEEDLQRRIDNEEESYYFHLLRARELN